MAPAVAAVLAYCAISVLAYWPVSPVSSGQIMVCGCHDAAQEAWFLAWPAFALFHGHNIFFSNWLEYPGGVNLATNASMPLLGILVSPITHLAGPVAAYNFLLRLSFALSATSAFFVFRRWARWTPAAFLGGLLYGFSPYMVGEGLGHAFLVFAPLPPLMFLTVEELVVKQRRPAWRTGGILGLLAAMQFYISTEVLVMTALLAAIATAIAAAARPRAARTHLRHALAGLGYALVVTGVLVGYATWMYLRGPQHITGPPHSVAGLAPFHADLLSAVIPSQSERIAPFGLWAVGNRLTGYDVTETGAYIGVPLLGLLGVLIASNFREARIRLAAAMAAISYLLSLGAFLDIDGVDTHIPLPFDLLRRVPVVQGVTAGRFSLFTNFFLAVILAVGIDRVRNRLTTRARGTPRQLALAGVCVLCLVPLLPSFPYHEVGTAVPPYFTSRAVERIPSGSVVLTYPYPYTPDDQAMLWEATTGMRFRIFGGQAAIPGRGGRTRSAPTTLAPRAVEALFLYAMYGTARIQPAPPRLDSTTYIAIRDFVRNYDVGTVIVDPIGEDPDVVVAALRASLGVPPKREGGVEVWYDVGKLATTGSRSR